MGPFLALLVWKDLSHASVPSSAGDPYIFDSSRKKFNKK